MTTDNTSDRSNNTATESAKRANRARIAIVALTIAGSAGAGGYVVGAQQPASPSVAAVSVDSVAGSSTYAMNRALAQFARANNLTGLSPASLAPERTQTLAEFARENNLTGLSPASLAPIESDQGE